MRLIRLRLPPLRRLLMIQQSHRPTVLALRVLTLGLGTFRILHSLKLQEFLAFPILQRERLLLMMQQLHKRIH